MGKTKCMEKKRELVTKLKKSLVKTSARIGLWNRSDFWRERPGNGKGGNGDWKKGDSVADRAFSNSLPSYMPFLFQRPYLVDIPDWLFLVQAFWRPDIARAYWHKCQKKEHLHFSAIWYITMTFRGLSRADLCYRLPTREEGKKLNENWMESVTNNNSII